MSVIITRPQVTLGGRVVVTGGGQTVEGGGHWSRGPEEEDIETSIARERFLGSFWGVKVCPPNTSFMHNKAGFMHNLNQVPQLK